MIVLIKVYLYRQDRIKNENIFNYKNSVPYHWYVDVCNNEEDRTYNLIRVVENKKIVILATTGPGCSDPYIRASHTKYFKKNNMELNFYQKFHLQRGFDELYYHDIFIYINQCHDIINNIKEVSTESKSSIIQDIVDNTLHNKFLAITYESLFITESSFNRWYISRNENKTK